MSGIAARFSKILVLAGVALAVTASSGTAATTGRARILGAVPHAGVQLARAPIPHALSTTGIRAAAGPTTLTFDTSYQSVINQFFTDVAHDSGGVDNVYPVAKEYTDGSGAIQYQSIFGGSYVAHDPLPANGCDDGFDIYCLTDEQLQQEIQNVMTAKGWQGGLSHIFFLMTPNGVGSCGDDLSGECSTNSFCAYHSAFGPASAPVIYANEPYEGPYPGCIDPGTQGFPHDTDADTTVNTISHEHNEAITDPFGNGWIANDGNENGDLCAYGFGASLGGTPGSDAYNQVINGHHYDLQQEWSNLASGCIQRPGGAHTPPEFGSGPLLYGGGPVMHTNTVYAIYWLPTASNTNAPGVIGTAVVNQTLTTSNGSWAGGAAGFSYQWQRCSSVGTSCVNIAGATATTYKLTTADGGHVVRSTVRATNVNGVSPPAASTGNKMVVDIPTATKTPHISGRAKVGKKLSGSHGTWTYSPTYAYQWLRCNAHGASCRSISRATHAKYKLTKRDAKHRLRLRVAATNAAGSGTPATSAATARVKR